MPHSAAALAHRAFAPPEEGERHLRDFLKHAAFLIQSAAMDGRLLFVNETWKQVLGYDDVDVGAGIRFADLLAPEERAEGEAVLAAMTREGARDVELLLVAKDGRRVRVAGEGDCRVVDGVPVAMRAIFRDVTAQRAAEARARLAEHRHEAVVSVLSEGIAIVAADGVVELVNPSAERILGIRARDVVGRCMLDWPWSMVDEDGGRLPREAHPVLVAIYTGEPQADTILGVRHGRSGEPVWVAVNARPLLDADGMPRAAVASFRDVTAARAAQVALREREARFRGILETVRSVAICLDREGRLTFANDFLLELTGWTRDEVMGVDWFERFLADGRDLRAMFREMIGRGEVPTYYEGEIVTRGGVRRTILWDSTVLRDDRGAVVGSASIGQDVTERRRVARLKDDLIAVASHELRTPLTALRGALDLALDAPALGGDERQRTLLGMAARNAQRMSRLVNDLLDIERIESGTEMLRPAPVALAPLFAAAVDGVRAVAEQGGVRLHAEPTELGALADAERIAQVLVNLLGNAIKFSPAGALVSLTARAEGEEVHVAVRDEGRGIPADKVESIFEPFVQVRPSDARGHLGTGLGLAICRAIVTQHGGRIWAESAGTGRGTTVSFTLPRSRA